MDDRIATEEDRVVFLGHPFRSAGHLGWFIVSMAAMASVIACRLIWPGAMTLWEEMVIDTHGGTACVALFTTRFGRRNGVLYSRDCIWFNFLMAALNALIAHASR
jgi:hypothetical protein